MADAYASFAVEFEADLSGVQSGMSQGLQWGRVYGEGMANSFMEGFQSVHGALGMLQGIRGQFRDTGQALSEIFGMKSSANIEYYRRQLTGLTGDAAQANKILDSLVNLASTTNFGNDDIFRLATNMIGSGTAPAKAPEQVQNLIDAASASGTRNISEFKRLTLALMHLRMTPDDQAHARDVQMAMRASPQLMKQASNVLGDPDMKSVFDKITTMTGSELVSLFEQIGQRNKGRAQQEGMADPFVAAENASEALANAMAPTGKLLNQFLMPLLGEGVELVGLFDSLNKIGHGIPGLLLGFGVLEGTMKLYQSTIGRTTLALNALAASAERAALTSGTGAASGAAMGAGVGAKSIVGQLALPLIVGITAHEMAVSMSDWLSKKGGFLGRYGAAGRAAADSAMIPGIGGFMAPFKAIEAWRSYREPGEGGIHAAAQDLKEAAKDLKEASAVGYGYGTRGKHIMSSIEAGYALLGAERLGVA